MACSLVHGRGMRISVDAELLLFAAVLPVAMTEPRDRQGRTIQALTVSCKSLHGSAN